MLLLVSSIKLVAEIALLAPVTAFVLTGLGIALALSTGLGLA